MIPDSTAIAESVRVDLFFELVNRLGEARFRAMGSSMLPAVGAGDVLTIQKCESADACAGDIAVFAREGRLFAHRVVSRGSGGLVTRGDNLEAPDAPVSEYEFLGRVVRVEPPSVMKRLIRRGQQLRRRLVAA